MRTVARRALVAVALLHGLIHLLGAAKGLGWADVPQLADPISDAGGVLWLAAAVLLVTAGGLLATGVRWWWGIGLPAVLLSQGLILTAWSDAWAGTIANVVLLAAVVHDWAAHRSRTLTS